MGEQRRDAAGSRVVIVGAGNAALCAGIAALQAGATSVAILEAAAEKLRGGNSCLTRSMRFAWPDGACVAGLVPDANKARIVEQLVGGSEYPAEQYFDDWLRVSGSQVDAALIESIVRRSGPTIEWMYRFGQRWEPRRNPLPSDVPVVFDGGGQALQDRNFTEFERLGGTVHYDSVVTGIEPVADGRFLLRGSGAAFPVGCDALVLASGGFEANGRLRERHLGQPWRDVKLRGVPFNTGAPLEAAIAIGADTAGNWRKCHATPQGTGLPDHLLPGQMHESHDLTRYAYPRGIVVNRDGRRFFDESADSLGAVWHDLGELDEAADHLRQALRLLHEAFEQAATALDLARAATDRIRETEALHTLGTIHDRLGNHAEAARTYRLALDLARATGYRFAEATALIGLATVGQDPDRAREARGVLDRQVPSG